MPDILSDAVAAAAGIAAALLLLRALPLATRIETVLSTMRKALTVIGSKRISEHWKERVVPAYSAKIFLASLDVALRIALVLLAFVAGFAVAHLPVTGDAAVSAGRLLHWQPQIIAFALAMGYWLLWPRSRPESPDSYSKTEQALHELALGNPATLRLAFQADCLLPTPEEASRPVYVAGLARSGTTILLEALHVSGCFASLTYRHMPFVTAPRLWSAISYSLRRDMSQRERAHGDGILVDADSPEALEEVFWLMACGPDYVKQLGLSPHGVDTATLHDYRRFVANVVKADRQSRGRYLAKGNNNLLRLDALLQAFPDATVIVPFREPQAHAISLLRQHRRFLEIHASDPFAARYMNWLGHFEFGSHFKPFLFKDIAPPSDEELGDIDFWRRYWHGVYRHVLEHYALDDRIVLFDYDHFTREPAAVLARLTSRLALPPGALDAFATGIAPPAQGDVRSALPADIETVYGHLQQRAL